MAVDMTALLERQTQLLEALLLQQQQGKSAPGYAPRGRQSGQPIPLTRKHSGDPDMITLPPANLGTPAGVYEYFPVYDERGPYGGFFQDTKLNSTLMNLLIYPVDGLASRIPVRPNNNVEERFGFLARYDVTQPPNQVEGDVCEPAPYLTSDMDFIKISLPYGRLVRAMNTMDIHNLLLQAGMNQFDQFFIMGNWRGVSDSMDISTFRDASGGMNEGLIRASAIARKLGELGSFFQQWTLHKVWTGDPANSAGAQTTEFFGMYRLINGSYSTSGLPIISTSGTNTPANLVESLSSLTMNASGHKVGDGTWSLWRVLVDMERLLYQRAAGTGMLPVRWEIYMPPMLWAEIVKHLACEQISDGCVIPGGGITPTFNLNDGGTALYNMTTRAQLEQSQSLVLNGRAYPVILDETMPYTVTTDGAGAFTGYKGDIMFIPFSVAGGEQVLYWEYIDFSKLGEALAPLANRILDAKGWSDSGRYWQQITTLRNCMELQTEFRPRLIFRAPQLAARLDNVEVSTSGMQWPLPYDGAGGRTSWLVPPTPAP